MRNVLLLGHACAPVRRLRAAPRREGPTGQIEGTLASANVGQTNPEGATRNHPLMVFTAAYDTDPSLTEVRDACEAELPGAKVRRHLLWRYSVVWRKPAR